MIAGFAIRARDRSTSQDIYWDEDEWITDLDKVRHLYAEPEVDVIFSIVLINWVSHVDNLGLIEVIVDTDGKRSEFTPPPKKVGFLGRLFGSKSRS